MFCPQCGKECGEGYGFCLSCGCKLDAGAVGQSTENNNLYSQDFQTPNNVQTPNNAVPEPVRPLEPAGQSFMSYDSTAGVIDNKRSSGGAKRVIIIAVVALLVALLGVFSFLFIRNRMEREYLVNNPTRYVLSSYQTYFDNSGSEENNLFAVLKSCNEQGTVKVSAAPKNDEQGSSMDMVFSYDNSGKKYYMKSNATNVPNVFIGSAAGTENTLFEIYTDVNRIDFNFDMNGKQGKYYVESGKLREQAGNSIFSPDKDNVLNIDEEEFNQFISQFESMYHNLQNIDSKKEDMEEFYDGLLKKIEQDCKVTVGDGTATVNGKDVSVDIVTYTLDYNAILAILNDTKTEIVNYQNNNKDDIGNKAELIDSINETFDNLISSFSESEQAKSILITLTNYTRKDNKEIAKLELNLKAAEDVSSNIKISLEFSHEPYMNIKFTVSNVMFSTSVSLYKEVNGGVVSYVLTAGSDTDGSASGQEIARIDYDDNNNKLTLTAGGQSYTCDAVVEDNKASFSFEVPSGSSYDTSENQTVSMKIEISSVPEMNTINAEKNLFDMTKEEYEDLAPSYDIPYSYDGYDDYYDSDYYDDYNYYDDSDYAAVGISDV